MRHPLRKQKFNAKPTEYGGWRYDSKKEAEYARKLDLAKRAGHVLQWLRQVPFHLPGHRKYICDFLVFFADGTLSFIDVKGRDTPMSKLKREQVAELYAPIEIEVVT